MRPTPREVEIIQRLAEGKSNKEIAAELGITLRTVETHRARIMTKMGLHSLPELIHYAIQDKIITTQDLRVSAKILSRLPNVLRSVNIDADVTGMSVECAF